ncbi:MAG: hypothetical protein FWE37_00500 [Spirochaetaceae bacterium]|nr:hypothetical protein [Spirochaetaceae bacterium]
MKKYLFIILILSVNLVVAYQWPSTGGEISSLFGSFRQGVVAKRITISSQEPLTINPIEDGSLLFVQTADDAIMPVRAGSTVIIQNNNQIRSIYSHLNNVNIINNINVSDTFAAAAAGDNGYSFNLALYDNALNQFVNPLLFLPLPGQLNIRPTIHNVSFLSANGNLITATNNMQLSSGHYQVLINATQPSTLGRYSLIAYSFNLEFMGNIVNRFAFNAFSTGEGMATLHSTNLTGQSLYADNGMLILGSLNLAPGQFFITVRAANIFGNEHEQTLLVIVN